LPASKYAKQEEDGEAVEEELGEAEENSNRDFYTF